MIIGKHIIMTGELTDNDEILYGRFLLTAILYIQKIMAFNN